VLTECEAKFYGSTLGLRLTPCGSKPMAERAASVTYGIDHLNNLQQLTTSKTAPKMPRKALSFP